MNPRANLGARPQITFTSDFHELVQGSLVPGPCVLRYDPLRLVALGDAQQETHHIQAYVRFRPGAQVWKGSMELPSGLPLAELADPAGQGWMLETTFTLPSGCDELEVWFSCTHEDGVTHWDSDFGKNHWLRFGVADLTVDVAKVGAKAGTNTGKDNFDVEFTTPSKVEEVEVRWRATNNPGSPRTSTSLTVTPKEGGGKTWSAPEGGIPVPQGAVIAFDVVYRVGDHYYTDDNQGRWYIAD